MADEPHHGDSPGEGPENDRYVELFHDLRTSHRKGQQAPGVGGLFGIAVGLVIGFALIIAVILAWGRANPDRASSGPGIYVCEGIDATITGTDDDDVIDGTPQRDIIHARRGNDVVNGFGGNDVICGGKGDDSLNGGRGKDTLVGGNGTDLCTGGRGADNFKGCESENQ